MTAPTQQQQGQQPTQQGQGQPNTGPTQQQLPATVTPPQDHGQQQGQQQTQQPTNPWQGLLDVAPPQGGQQAGQQAGQQQGLSPLQPPPFDPNQLVTLVTSVIDRRINQLNNPQWQQAHAGQQGQQQPVTQAAPPTYQPPVPAGPSDADQREARMAAMMYLSDRITFGSEAERSVAMDLATSLIPNQLVLGMTPNQAALAVSQQVADRVSSLRRDYEDRAVRGLRARGLLAEPPQGPAQMAGSIGIPVGGTPVSTAQQQDRAARHNKLQGWAAEENAQRGWDTPKTATAVSG